MSNSTTTFSEPEIVTNNTLEHRSYISFYFNGERKREYHAKCINLNINPNRANTVDEKQVLLKRLCFEIHRALVDGSYNAEMGISKSIQSSNNEFKNLKVKEIKINSIQLLFGSVVTKLRSDLSRTYKRDLKAVYRQFRDFLTCEEKTGVISNITASRIETFLCQFGSSGTYYMNKRRALAVLFASAGRKIDQPLKSVKTTPKRKVKAKLHEKYSKEQLNPVLIYLKANYYNLWLCCLLTYGTWLRPHEEIRLLKVGDFKFDFSQIHLSGGENKGGKVRVVFVPEYIRFEVTQRLKTLDRNLNIFTLTPEPFNYSYFNTQWSRAYPKMYLQKLVYENQTIYSFRHTAAVLFYKKTKDVYWLQKLLGHSNIIVTLKYLRTLGELTFEELKEGAPSLEL